MNRLDLDIPEILEVHQLVRDKSKCRNSVKEQSNVNGAKRKSKDHTKLK